MKGLKRVGAFALVAVMLLTMLPSAAFAAYSDTSKHWAKTAIDRWSTLKVLLGGSDGKFRPDAPVTRGELATILDRVMGYQTKASSAFSDISPSDFYYEPILKANYAGVILGSNGKANPKSNVTRQDAAVMFARAFKIDFTEGGYTTFKDDASIDNYAKGACQQLQQRGYLQGDSAGFRPKGSLTRAEAVTVLNRIVSVMAADSGTLEQNVTGNLLIKASSFTVKNITVSGDVYVAPGVADGSVAFDGTKITGRVYVMGGGSNSVSFLNNADCASVEVMRIDGPVRVASGYGNTLDNVNIRGGGQVLLAGAVSTVTQTGSGADLYLSSATVNKLNMNITEGKVEVDSSSKVTELNTTALAPSAVINNKGTITRLNQSALNTGVTNSGTIDEVNITAMPKSFANSNVIKKATFNVSGAITGNGTVDSAEASTSDVEITMDKYPATTTLVGNSSLTVGPMNYLNADSKKAEVFPASSGKTGAPPMVTKVDLSSDKRTLTITFDKTIVNNKTSTTYLKGNVNLATNGTSFRSLASNDEVSISGSTLVVDFDSALSGSDNKVRIAGGTLKDSSSNVQQFELTTAAISGVASSSSDNNISGLGVKEFSPSKGSSSAPISGDLTLTFNKRVEKGTGTKYISIYRSNGTLIEDILVSSSRVTLTSNTVVTVEPASELTVGYSYYVLIDKGAFTSYNDNDEYPGISSKTEWTFTVSNDGLVVSSYSPARDATSVAAGAVLKLTFNKRVSKATTTKYVYIYRKGSSSYIERFNVSNSDRVSIGGSSNNVVTITPTDNFQNGYSYYVKIDDGAFKAYSGSDVYGGISSTTAWAFTCGSDMSVDEYFPANASTGIATNASLVLSFDRSVKKPSNAGSKYITIYTYSDNKQFQKIAVSSSNISVSSYNVTISHTAFAVGTRYYVLIDSGAFESNSGGYSYGGIDSRSIWNFTAGPGITLGEPSPSSFEQGKAATGTIAVTTANIANNQNLTVTITSGKVTVPSTVKVTNNSSVIDITVPSDAAAGTYKITVSYSGASSVSKEIRVGAPTISLTEPSPATHASGTAGTSTITATASSIANGQSLTVSVSPTNGNVTVSATAVSSNKSTITVNVPANAVAGNYVISVGYTGMTAVTRTVAVSANNTKNIFDIDPKFVTSITGIKYGQADHPLPTAVKVFLEDTTSAEIPVTWSAYNPIAFGTEQTLTGIWTMPANIANPKNIACPSLKVTVDVAVKVTAVQNPTGAMWKLSDGTNSLPAQVDVTLDTSKPTKLDVIWDTTGLSTDTTTVTGTLVGTVGIDTNGKTAVTSIVVY